MREQVNELWQIVSIRPLGQHSQGIEHVTYKSTKGSADEYVEWLGAEQYNRGKVKSVTQYLRAGSELTPSMSRETALGYLNTHLIRSGILSQGIQHPEQLYYVRWMEKNIYSPWSGVSGVGDYLMEAWVWESFATVFCEGKVVSVVDDFHMQVRY